MPAHFPLQAPAAAEAGRRLAEQRVSGARIAYSLRQLQADAAGDGGSVWCDGAGACIELHACLLPVCARVLSASASAAVVLAAKKTP